MATPQCAAKTLIIIPRGVNLTINERAHFLFPLFSWHQTHSAISGIFPLLSWNPGRISLYISTSESLGLNTIMVRFRRSSFEDPQGPLPPVSLPAAALPFVQQLRFFLAGDTLLQRASPYAAIVHDHAAVCWLDSKNDRMMTTTAAPIALTQLQSLLSEERPPLTLAPVSREVFLQRAVVSSSVPMRPTLWDIGLCTAGHGALMSPLQKDTKLRLRRWPDFRILAHRHDHFRICALLIKQGASVQACSDLLNVPHQQVQSFFNAAFLTAYAFPVMGEETAVRRAPTVGLAHLWRQIRIRWST